MTRTTSPLLRWIEPLAGAVWIGFWVWTALTAVVWVGAIGDAEAAAWAHRHFGGSGEIIVGEASPLERALGFILAMVDPVWIVLGALHCYTSVAAEEGLSQVRRWSAWILGTGLALGWLSARNGYPLGALVYTARLGPRLGPVPLGYPLLWLVLVLGARQFARRLFPRGAHWQIAALTGALALLTDINLEPLAWHARVWWLWSTGGPVAANYLTYGLAATVLAWFCRSGGDRVRREGAPHAAFVLLALNTICLLTHASRWLWPSQ